MLELSSLRGFEIRSASSPDLGSRFPGHILCVFGGLFYPQKFESTEMIECFHCSLKSSLQARLAGSDWVSHFPLVMLSLQSSPKDDSGFSPAEAVFGFQLSLPDKILEHTEFTPEIFLRRVEQVIAGFSGPPRHHVAPQPLP